MKFVKGGIYAIPLPENRGYIYFLYIGGNSLMGDFIKVYDYETKTIEKDLDKIISQKMLFDMKYIMVTIRYDTFVPITLVGKIKLDFKGEMRSLRFFQKDSIQANRNGYGFLNLSEGSTIEEWEQAQINYIKENKPKMKFDDWEILVYGVVSDSGKIDHIKDIYIGNLSKEYLTCQKFGCFYTTKTIIEYYLNRIDSNTAESIYLI